MISQTIILTVAAALQVLYAASIPNESPVFLAKTARQLDKWDSFEPIELPGGHKATSGASLIHSTTEYTDIFFRGENFQLLYGKMDADGKVFEIVDLGELLAGPPSAVSPHYLAIDVVILSAYRSNPMIISLRNGVWSGFVDLGGSTPFSPTVSSPTASKLDVFVGGTDNRLYQKSFNGTWGAWLPHRKVLSGPPFAISTNHGSSEVFVRDMSNVMVHKEFPNGGDWKNVSDVHHMYSSVCVSHLPRSKVVLFVKNRVGTLSTFEGHLNEYEAVHSPTITITGDSPGCASSRFHTDVVVLFKDALYHGRYLHQSSE